MKHYLEVLDEKNHVLSSYKLNEGLTLLGQSPGAHVQLSGKNVAPLHVAIKGGKTPVIMDLGGAHPLKVNGKASVEHILDDAEATLDIGSRRVRLKRVKEVLKDVRTQTWAPLADEKSKELVIRVRLYMKSEVVAVVNTTSAFTLDENYGVINPARLVFIQGQNAQAQVPAEWIRFGGRIQAGKEKIAQLQDWAQPVTLEKDTIYRIYAGPYLAEILITTGSTIIGTATPDYFPRELRKPFGISAASVLIMFALWFLMFGRPKPEVEEPYPVYARIQNIPVEKLPEPEPSSDNQAGGGSGSQANETTAPQIGGAASAPSKAAQALTGGLKNLIGSVLSSAKTSNVVLAETGVGQAAAAAGGATSAQTGKLASVGQGTAAVAGASKLGNLGVKGSDQGFSGGSGTGLGTGHGSGIGTGVGDGIGRGGFKLVEEESIVDGGLDKSVIAAVIQNNLAQIKYCYERQLVAEPDLFGKVVVLWQINASGSVEGASVKQTTLNSQPVEQCMLAKISGWKFPQPKNGTKVTVSYPFLFKSTK